MSRTVGSKGEHTLNALLEAGVKRLSKQGFVGMTMRELAGDVGIQAGSLYNYFKNKQDFLCQILLFVMGELTEELESRLAGKSDARAAMQAFVECHVTFHSKRKEEVLISTTELRSLTPENYRIVVALRDSYEGHLKSIIEWGNNDGLWQVKDPTIATKLIIGMMTSVGVWYKEDGRYQISDVVHIYQDTIEKLFITEYDARTAAAI